MNTIIRTLTLTLCLWLVAAGCVLSQTLVHQEEIAEQKRAASDAFKQERYDESLTAYGQLLELLKQEPSPTDSLQANALALMGRCQYRLQKLDDAIGMMKSALELYGSKVTSEDMCYANYLDNLSVYYVSKKAYDLAYDYSQRALAICYKLLPNNYDMSIILMHAAEASSYNGKPAEAAVYQSHSLNVLEAIVGVHSDAYLSELDYLIKYYSEAKDEENRTATEAKKKEIEEELKYGFVSPLVPFDTAEKCREHNFEAYYCCKYFLNHMLNASQMNVASQYILRFSNASADVTCIFGEAEERWMKEENGQIFMFAYLAGTVMYALENGPEADPLETYRAAVIATVNYYATQKELTGEVKALEAYIQLYQKDPKDFDKQVEKDYKAYEKQAKQGNTTKADIIKS